MHSRNRSLLADLGLAQVASAQGFPSKPIDFVTPGDGVDIAARIIGEVGLDQRPKK